MGTRRDDPAAAHHCFVSRGRATHNIDALARHWWRKSLENRRDHLRSRANSLVRRDRCGSRYLGGRADCLACDQRPTRFARAFEGINYVTSALPGIVVALALVTITIRFARPSIKR
jgi:hypothetical protein